MNLRFLTALLMGVVLVGCASVTPTAPGNTARTPISIAERYVSPPHPGTELDSLAIWPTPDGDTWLIASAKSGHQLLVFDADSGALLQTVGSKGDAPGHFLRPNGVAIHGNLLFVVERDNHRIQVLELPRFKPLGSFGEAQLRSPYGLWINSTAPGELEVYVTDSFMYGERFDVVPSPAELNQRVRRYRIQPGTAGELHASYLESFGDTAGPGTLRVVESIAGDAAHGRLLIADEYDAEKHRANDGSQDGPTLREYNLDGHYSGVSLPSDTFAADAEGVALWPCRNGGGYWIAVDQNAPLTTFHLFERDSLRPVASFRGRTTSRSDGIALHAASTSSFPDGLLAAVHDDQAVAAFDLADIARALGLSADCTATR